MKPSRFFLLAFKTVRIAAEAFGWHFFAKFSAEYSPFCIFYFIGIQAVVASTTYDRWRFILDVVLDWTINFPFYDHCCGSKNKIK